jgi:hypothetical protein
MKYHLTTANSSTYQEKAPHSQMPVGIQLFSYQNQKYFPLNNARFFSNTNAVLVKVETQTFLKFKNRSFV